MEALRTFEASGTSDPNTWDSNLQRQCCDRFKSRTDEVRISFRVLMLKTLPKASICTSSTRAEACSVLMSAQNGVARLTALSDHRRGCVSHALNGTTYASKTSRAARSRKVPSKRHWCTVLRCNTETVHL